MKALTNNVKGRPMKYSPINLTDKFSKFNEQWQPKDIAEMNDYQFKIARIEGEFVWHNHPDTDETFIIIEGTLDLEFRDGKVTLSAGEMFVVPKGVEHKPVANSECKIMMIEPRGTKPTGDIDSNLPAENDVWV
jgi:mannose-6-phosphate isomerase-like protein (cupin superfamily)